GSSGQGFSTGSRTSTGRTSSRKPEAGSTPPDDGPAPAGEADREQGQPHRDQNVESDPDAHDSPVASESQRSERDEDRARSDHRPHQVRGVSGTDQDPV